MKNNIKTGKIGENIACRHLLNNKYLILARNHREYFDEIDIIARHPDGTLVFCEVKTINNNEQFSVRFMPEDNLSSAKLRKMIRSSSVFLARHPELIREKMGWRIDLIAIILRDGELDDLHHYENI